MKYDNTSFGVIGRHLPSQYYFTDTLFVIFHSRVQRRIHDSFLKVSTFNLSLASTKRSVCLSLLVARGPVFWSMSCDWLANSKMNAFSQKIIKQTSFLGDHKLIFRSVLKTYPPSDLFSELFSNRSFSQTWCALLAHTDKSSKLMNKSSLPPLFPFRFLYF